MIDGVRSEPLGQGGALFAGTAGEDDLCALGDEEFGGGCADPAGASGDDSDFVL